MIKNRAAYWNSFEEFFGRTSKCVGLERKEKEMKNILDIVSAVVDVVQAVGNTIVDKVQEVHPNDERDKKIDNIQGIINTSIDELKKLSAHVE